MSDDLSQLDALIESDILEALGQSVPKEEAKTDIPTSEEPVDLDNLDALLGSTEIDSLDDLLGENTTSKEIPIEESPSNLDVDQLLSQDVDIQEQQADIPDSDESVDLDNLLDSNKVFNEEINTNTTDNSFDEELSQTENLENIDNLSEIEISQEEISQDTVEDEKIVDDIGDIEILPMAEIESALEEQEEEEISMNSNDLGSLADMLSKLLNNKTIEITIKIKDN